MALTPSQRPTREWPLLVLAVALVAAVCMPLGQWIAHLEPDDTPWFPKLQRLNRLLFGPEQIICYCFFTWAGFILMSRYWELGRQRRAFRLGLLPTEEGARILPEDARPLQRKVDQISKGKPYILANLIRLALGKYALSRSSQDVSETVRAQSDVDLGRLVTGMATVHFLAWAIPAVGFLGTVRGLAMSMSLAGRVKEGGIEDFLKNVTEHLDVAFDCTLVALALSLPLMFFLHAIQRDEEALVIDCQQYCLEHLVNRLYDPEPLAPEDRGAAAPSHRHREGAAMKLAGLDLNSTRVRAVVGPPDQPTGVALEDDAGELPLAIDLQKRALELGRAALSLVRQSPHLVCWDFLGDVGTERVWKAGRHRLDAGRALSCFLERLAKLFKGIPAAVALPSYLERTQVESVVKLAEKARLSMAGAVTASLAAAYEAYAERPWNQVALHVDADDHALTWTILLAENGQLRVLGQQILPKLGLKAWKTRVLDAIADRCVYHSRRDPRESATAEQMLYDQLDSALAAAGRGQMVELDIQTAQWFQNLHLHPEEFEAYAAPLAHQALEGMWAALVATSAVGRPSVVLANAAVEPLPGLLAALPEHLGERTPIRVLPSETTARGAHRLAARFQLGSLPRDPMPAALPLPAAATLVERIIPFREAGR